MAEYLPFQSIQDLHVPPTATGRGQCMHGAAGPADAMLGALPGRKPAI